MLPYRGDHHIFFMQRVVLKPMSIGLFGRAPAPRLSDGVISVVGEQVENDSSEGACSFSFYSLRSKL
jgi:hypothetical protein